MSITVFSSNEIHFSKSAYNSSSISCTPTRICCGNFSPIFTSVCTFINLITRPASYDIESRFVYCNIHTIYFSVFKFSGYRGCCPSITISTMHNVIFTDKVDTIRNSTCIIRICNMDSFETLILSSDRLNGFPSKTIIDRFVNSIRSSNKKFIISKSCTSCVFMFC